jgi:hypothetical protein
VCVFFVVDCECLGLLKKKWLTFRHGKADSLSVKEEILNLPLFPNVYEYDTQECVNAANGQHIIVLLENSDALSLRLVIFIIRIPCPSKRKF